MTIEKMQDFLAGAMFVLAEILMICMIVWSIIEKQYILSGVILFGIIAICWAALGYIKNTQ